MLRPKTIHPTNRTLLSYLDGELLVEERHALAAHLRDCETCRNELDAIEADLDWFLVLDAAACPADARPPADGVNRLLHAARELRRESPALLPAAQADAAGTLEEQTSAAMAELIGAKGQAVDPAAAESLLAAFLGRQAAGTLLKNIRRRVEVGRFLSPDLT